MPSSKHQPLTIMLLKDGLDSFDDAIGKDVKADKYELKNGGPPIGTLYVKPSFPHPPKWTSFFDPFIDPNAIGKNATVAAVLLVERGRKKFAVTFGPGRYLLKPDIWVERFGLRVALNSIGKDKIRTIDKTTFDAISRHSKEQGSTETDVDNFGLDVEQDLLRAVVGTPKSPTIGKRISGMDSLTVLTNTEITELGDYLDKIHEKYVDESYKIDFPWIDQIGEVKDKATIAGLDGLLASKVATGEIERIWMAVPEIIEWDQVNGFCYQLKKSSAEYPDIHLADFLSSLKSDKDDTCVETFTKNQVHCIDSEGYQMGQWQAYKCLYAELTEGEKTYLLNGGKWYVVAGDFVARVNEEYRAIPNCETKLPDYKDASEGKYNERVVAEMPGQFVLMDRKEIRHGGGQSQIEFCDLYSADCDIIHVKHYGASSVLSHLFAQGKISGELFQMDPKFREKVSEELPDGFKVKDTKERPETNRYRVVYAIISHAPGDLDIPFFSRLNMKNSARSLVSMGYRVAKSKIDVDATKAKVQKFRKRAKRK